MTLSPKLKKGVTVFLVIAFFIVVNLTPAAKEIKNFFYFISSPIQKVIWGGGKYFSDLFEMVFEMRDLKENNEALELQLQELLSENTQIAKLEKENETLREALRIGLEEEFELEMTEVIGKDISQDFLLINKGQGDGLTENLPVITQQKVLVGKIAQVYKDFSKVALISNQEISFNVEIQEKELEGVMRGRGNLKLFLELVPKEKEIKEGDLLITTSLGRIFPEGLLVGHITKVESSDIEPFQMARVNPIFEIGKVEILFVITSF